MDDSPTYLGGFHHQAQKPASQPSYGREPDSRVERGRGLRNNEEIADKERLRPVLRSRSYEAHQSNRKHKTHSLVSKMIAHVSGQRVATAFRER